MWVVTIAFFFGVFVCWVVEVLMSDRDSPRDDDGKKMNDKQAINWIVKELRIHRQFIGLIPELSLRIRWMERALREILFLLKEGTEAVRFGLTVTLEDGTTLEDPVMANLTDTQQLVARIKPKKAGGKPADVQAGSVEWSSSDEAILTVTEDPGNELSALVKAAGVPGSAQVRFSADADLGAGAVVISGVLDVEVTASMATGFDIETDPPTEQPDAPPVG